MSSPQSSPHGPLFHNNNNNNTSNMNHNHGSPMMKGVVPSATSMAALLSSHNSSNNGHSHSHPSLMKQDQGHEKFISQRRNHHHGHGHGYHHQQQQQQAHHDSYNSSIKSERKSPNYSEGENFQYNYVEFF